MNCEALLRTHLTEFRQGPRSVLVFASCMIVACFLITASSVGQSSSAALQSVVSRTSAAPQSIISLASSAKLPAEIVALRANDSRFENAPANYHVFGAATVGEEAAVEELTLNFAGETTLTRIKSTSKDFVIEPGGTCQEGDSYRRGESCSLLVRFNPQGPGHRLGFLSIAHSAQATPASFGLTGNGYAPVVSFIPAQITTVPATVSSGTGVINSATNLAIDGGDILYIADTGADLLREIDSSGTMKNTSPAFSAPVSIAVDSFGFVWALAKSGSTYYFTNYLPWNSQTGWFAAYVSGSTCTVSAPCNFDSSGSPGMDNPAEISIDSNDNLFMEEETQGALEMYVGSYSGDLSLSAPLNMWYLSDVYAYFGGTTGTFAVNADDYLFTANSYTYTSECFIVEEPVYGAEDGSPTFTRVAGGENCGFSGDGGQGAGAEISSTIGQIAFDSAGDLYFSDAGNQRVRRIEYNTGIIRTIAGDGTAGYTGDGGRATSAELSSPTGVGVDSQGNVYVISSATSGQVIRKVGSPGMLVFAKQQKTVASAAQLVTVTNTGNSEMTLTNAVITGANAADFKIDNTTTTCILTQGSNLYAGNTCRIGVIFTPGAVGARTATLTLLDNTVNGADSVTLSGTGILGTPTLKITAPANGSSFTSGTAVTFSVSVTSASGPQPTGTVQFIVDGKDYGSAVTLSATGTASTSVTGLSVASHTLSATYSGDANYAAAGPVSVTITVTSAAVVKFTSPVATEVLASKTAVVVAVEVTARTGPTPTGSVNFSVDGKSVATVKLVSGEASADAGFLAAGRHIVVATYSGDKYHPNVVKAEESITEP